MYFISALIILSLSFSHCFIFSQHRDVSVLENGVSKNNDNSHLPAEWIEQPLDHFNTNNETWKMRYFKRLSFWKPNGPIYLYINGESSVFPDWIEMDSLLTCQLAKETNGALFASEHRYYGESMPVEIKDTSSMKYLSSQQALADLATLIKSIKSAAEFKSSKVVVIGGSYAGNLAAWMRVLYPDLVDAAVSSSAPVLAKKDYYEYLETVSDTYEKYGSTDCLNKIKTMFSFYAELVKTSSGIEKLKKEFNICDESDMTIAENQAQFFYGVVSIYELYSQTGSPDLIKTHCQILQTNNWARSMQKSVEFLEELSSQRSTSNVRNVFQLNNWGRFTRSFKDSGCEHVNFTQIIEYAKAAKGVLYSWGYQTCTEFGYYQTTTSNKQAFSSIVPLDFYIKLCQGVFGEDFNEKRIDDAVAQTNAMYGGITPNVTNVVFTHGDMDPWHRLGVLKDLSETAVVRITNETSHCAVLRSPDSSDPDALTKDREYVKEMIKKWIKKV